MNDFLETLNEEQRQAATHIDGAMLILAGAGTGKTKTITTRLAYLISLGIDPAATLTLTFTNKAASEMRNRAISLLDNIAYPPMLSTFHRFGIFFLKQYMARLERENTFIVIDKQDKNKILKSMDEGLNVQILGNAISSYKNQAMSEEEIHNISINAHLKKIASAYSNYQKFLQKNNLVDFDDLLLLPHEVLSLHDDIREELSQKYQYIMVDEFQDTNKIQMQLLHFLCSTHENICVVGDDDQSIYSWRGAEIKNILRFRDKFNDTKIVTLQNNYRSTKQILEVSNRLISHNTTRYDKQLHAENGDGEKVEVIPSGSEQEEAYFVASKIKQIIGDGGNASQIAILFRIHAISRALEEYLYKLNIDYKIIGGIKFYERAEIKDVIAYFRLIILRDDFSLKRIINVPKRGVGKRSVEKMEARANELQLGIFEYLSGVSVNELSPLVGTKNSVSIKKFISDIEAMQSICENDMSHFITKLEERFELKQYYNSMVDGYDRVANVNEFYEYFQDSSEKDVSMAEFLNDITLQSDQDKVQGESVYLMSIHASKGLEFDTVFLVGLEDGVFPIISDDVDLEEERRLAYVAITRARQKLYLCFSANRLYKGRYTSLSKSMFLKNMFDSEKSSVPKAQTKDISSSLQIASFKVGEAINHKVFGMGKIEAITKINNQQKLVINFGTQKREILSQYVSKIS